MLTIQSVLPYCYYLLIYLLILHADSPVSTVGEGQLEKNSVRVQ